MIVIQHWVRQFDVGAQWCSPSHCGHGLEYWTQFQTHVSVIYRSVFHRRAVQGLRSACSALPGLSACRLFTDVRTNAIVQAFPATQVCSDAHEDKPHSSITHHDYSMISLRAPSSPASVSTFASPQWKARTLWIVWRWWWWWWWPHLSRLISP